MEQYLGQIKLFCGNFAPKDWAFCNGQLLPIAQNTALFSLLGTNYGGDGKSTFALPNLAGAAVVHPDFQPGNADGRNNKSLQPYNFPAHTHNVKANIKAKSTVDTKTSPVGNYPANSGGFTDKEYQTTAGQRMAADSLVVTSVSTEGTTSTPPSLSNMQPYLAVNFIICTNNGEYPPRP